MSCSSFEITRRHLLYLSRQRYYIASTLIQPVFVLLLLSQVVGRVVVLPSSSLPYDLYIASGLIPAMAMSSAWWSSLDTQSDYSDGFVDWMLVSGVSSRSLVYSRIAQVSILVLFRSLALWCVTILLDHNAIHYFKLFCALMIVPQFLATSITALTFPLVIAVQKRSSLVSLLGSIEWPLIFLSPMLVPLNLLSSSLQTIAKCSPLTWTIQIIRSISGGPQMNSDIYGLHCVLLAGFGLSCVAASLAVVRQANLNR